MRQAGTFALALLFAFAFLVGGTIRVAAEEGSPDDVVSYEVPPGEPVDPGQIDFDDYEPYPMPSPTEPVDPPPAGEPPPSDGGGQSEPGFPGGGTDGVEPGWVEPADPPAVAEPIDGGWATEGSAEPTGRAHSGDGPIAGEAAAMAEGRTAAGQPPAVAVAVVVPDDVAAPVAGVAVASLVTADPAGARRATVAAGDGTAVDLAPPITVSSFGDGRFGPPPGLLVRLKAALGFDGS